MDKPERYYRVLGLKPSASPDEVRQAYRDLVQVWHPDRFPGNARLQKKATDRLREINAAYEALCRGPDTPPPPRQPEPTPPPSGAPPAPCRRRWESLFETLGAATAILALLAGARYLHRAMTGPSARIDFILQDARRMARPRIAAPPLTRHPIPPAARRHGRVSLKTGAVPANGSDLMAPRDPWGSGTLQIVNRTRVDTIARVVAERNPKVPLRMVYVRAGETVLLREVGPGSYLVTFHSGSDWQPASRSFAKDLFSSGPFGPFRFLQIEDGKGIQSDHYQIVLKPE